LLIRFGGHSQAGGLSIEENKIFEFIDKLNDNISKTYPDSVFEPKKYYDFDATNFEINKNFVDQLELLEPCGFGNEKPMFLLAINEPANVNRMKNYDNHIKIDYNNLDVVGFNYGNFYNYLQTNSFKKILVELGFNTFNKKKTINATIKGLCTNKLNTSIKQELINAQVIKQLEFINDDNLVKFNTINDDVSFINNIIKSNIGTLIVTYNFNNYINFIKNYKNKILNYELYNINSNNAENTILFCPNFENIISNYSNVIFLEPVLFDGVLNKIVNANIYIVNSKNGYNLNKISVSREVFAKYHNAIKNAQHKEINAINDLEYFKKLVKLNPQYKQLAFDQFTFVTYVLQELGIIKISDDEFYYLTINSEEKNNLSNSKIYNYIKLLLKIY
jgi:single-stranded-DNA-specific exonuclease